ncbi:cysteine-rich PDZ-binding protein-like [Symsagittifera roscoffensis]|uniref:cysteine-rich PDZ-binding protein-like n=1 Tax=Symsagittifera roscoffensis TaxID=84072 RepID=UPI00307B905E
MVCGKCELKLAKIITPDPWKDGARSTTGGGGRKLNENKALSGKKMRYTPYATNFHKCQVCKQSLHQAGAHYCQCCAYKLGICALCGKKILDTSNYKQSSV